MGNGKRYCIAFDAFISDCKNNKCPIYPCSFTQVTKEVTNLFNKMGFSSTAAKKIGRRITYKNFNQR